MEDPRLERSYAAEVAATEDVDGRRCWVVQLTAKVEGLAYQTRRLWVDAERFVPLREDLFAKSGRLLKTIRLGDVRSVEGRWVPMHALYRDVMKTGGGTEFVIRSITFGAPLPGYLFSKAALRK